MERRDNRHYPIIKNVISRGADIVISPASLGMVIAGQFTDLKGLTIGGGVLAGGYVLKGLGRHAIEISRNCIKARRR